MKYRERNSVKDLQVLLKEAHLYTAGIDGLWGKGTAGGLDDLLGFYFDKVGKSPSLQKPVCNLTGSEAAVKGVTDLQANLKTLGLYLGRLDGICGPNTMIGVKRLQKPYMKAEDISPYDICWSASVPPEFTQAIHHWVGARGYWEGAADALMACMHFESGGTFDPSIQNLGGSKYFGLIQFGEMAAKDLGVSLEVLRSMTQLEQLEYVFRYFEMWEKRGKKYTRLEDFYLTILYPKAVGMKPDEILWEEGTKVYTQNRGLDLNRDGQITIGEISERLYQSYYTGMLPTNRVQFD